MKSLVRMWAALALAGVILAGCNKDSGSGPDEGNPPAGVSSEQTARVYFATNDEFVKNDEQTIDDQEIQPTDYGTFGKVDTAITPLRWGRFVRQVVRTVTDTVLPGDTLAIAHVHKVISGFLRIRGINPNGDTILVDKPFTDLADRNIIFKRVGRDARRFWLNWVPVATSLVAGGTSRPNNAVAVTKLELMTRNDTITVTDPLQYYLRYRWLRLFQNGHKDCPELQAGGPVMVKATIVSEKRDTDLVALRFGVGTFHKRRMRMQLISETPNPGGGFTRVYQAPFLVHFHRGFFHAAVDAMTKETLFDKDAPYAVSWWGIPYRVF